MNPAHPGKSALGLLVVAAASIALTACSSSSHSTAKAAGSTFSDPVSSASSGAVSSASAGAVSSPGGGSTAPTDQSTAPSGPASSPTAASASLPSTPALAALVVQPADLPGWQSSAYVPDTADAATQAALVACTGGKNSAADATGEAHSPDYKLATATVSSDATSFRTPADVAADVAVLHSPKIEACYDTVLKAKLAGSLQPGQSVTALSIKITPGAGSGPKNVVATGVGTVTVAVGAKTTSIYISVAFIASSTTEVEVDADGIGQPVPATIMTPLITKLAARAAKA